MIGMEIVDPDGEPDALGALPAAPATARRLRAELLARGVIAELGGRHGAVLRLLPPLTLGDDEAEHLLTSVPGPRALDAVVRLAGDPGRGVRRGEPVSEAR